MGIKRWLTRWLRHSNRDRRPPASTFGPGAMRARRAEGRTKAFDLEVERNRPKLGF